LSVSKTERQQAAQWSSVTFLLISWPDNLQVLQEYEANLWVAVYLENL